jgi:hypothetical protein
MAFLSGWMSLIVEFSVPIVAWAIAFAISVSQIIIRELMTRDMTLKSHFLVDR